jgi:hypothetical protein
MTLGRNANQAVGSYDSGGAAEASQQFNSFVQAKTRQRRAPSQYQPQPVIDLAGQSSIELLGSPTAVSTGKEASTVVGMVSIGLCFCMCLLAWTVFAVGETLRALSATLVQCQTRHTPHAVAA